MSPLFSCRRRTDPGGLTPPTVLTAPRTLSRGKSSCFRRRTNTKNPLSRRRLGVVGTVRLGHVTAKHHWARWRHVGVPVRASHLLGDLTRGPGHSALGLENLLGCTFAGGWWAQPSSLRYQVLRLSRSLL